MKPSPALQRFALALLIAGYAFLFSWLLVDTWHHSATFDVPAPFTATVPLLAGALGVILAHGLGVNPLTKIQGNTFGEKLGSFFSTDRLLAIGAIVYLVLGIVAIAVWIKKDTVTPALVSTIGLTVVGYLAASAIALSGGGGGGGGGRT